MSKRNKAVTVRLTEKEYKHLKKQAYNAGFKMEPFIRMLIEGCEIKPYPPEAYKGLLRELSAIGNNINQIAHVANMNGIGTKENREAIRLVGEAVRLVKETF